VLIFHVLLLMAAVASACQSRVDGFRA